MRESVYETWCHIRYGKTIEYFATTEKGTWIQVPTAEEAEYKRLICYDREKKPVGVVRDYYIDGTRQWQGRVFSLKPFRGEGSCRRFYEDGSMQDIEKYVNGKRHGLSWHYTHDPLKISMEYHQNDSLIIKGDNTLSDFIRGKSKSDLASIHYTLTEAQKQATKGNLTDAVHKVELLLDYYDDVTFISNMAADIFMANKEYGKAVACMETLLSKNDKVESDEKFRLAKAYYNNQQYDDLITYTDEIIADYKKSKKVVATAQGWKGLSQMQMQQSELGQQNIESALAAEPDPEIYYEYANYYNRRREYHRSNQILDIAIRYEPDFHSYYGLKALNYIHLRDRISADRYYDDYKLHLSSRAFSDSFPELIVSIDLENELSETGKNVFGAIDAISDGYHLWRNENPIQATILEEVGKWYWNSIMDD